MAQVGGAFVELASTGELVWTFPDSQVVEMSEDTAQKSPFFMNVRALLEQDDGRWARVCLPRNVSLPMWLDFAAATEAQRSFDRPCTDPEGILQVMLVRIRHVGLFPAAQCASATPHLLDRVRCGRTLERSEFIARISHGEGRVKNGLYLHIGCRLPGG